MRILATILLFLYTSIQALAFSDQFVRRDNLSSLDNSTVYSMSQDSTKAIWISCSAGLMRYNGNSIRQVYEVLPMQEISYDGGRSLWALSYKGLICVDVLSLKTKTISSAGRQLDFSKSKIRATSSSPLLFSGSDIWTVKADTLAHLLTLPSLTTIDYVDFDRQGNLYAATDNKLWRITESTATPVIQLPSNLSAFHFDSHNNLWVGFMHGALFKYDDEFNLVATYELQASNVRTFCEDHQGSVWVGSASSLHCISPEGICASAPESSPMSQPVTSLLYDHSGNLWVGTFYSGVYLSVGENIPFRNLVTPPSLRNVRCASPIGEGKVAVLTDGNGAWIYSRDGTFRKIPGSDAYKFICSCPAAGDNSIYAGLYRGGIVKVSEHSVTPVLLNSADGQLQDISVNALLRHGNKLFAATDNGLYTFEFPNAGNYLKGKKLEGINKQILALEVDEDDHLWACGRGLYILDSWGNPYEVDGGFYPALSCSGNEVWASEFGKGMCLVHAGGTRRFDDRNAGILDNYISFIHPFPGGLFLLGTRTGLSLFNPTIETSLNYSSGNGLSISSARSGCAISLDEDHCLVFGSDGAAVLYVRDIPRMTSKPSLTLDIIEAVGANAVFRPMLSRKPLRLSHSQNNLLLEFTDFDYSGVLSRNYEYSIGGGRVEWVPFNPSEPLSMIGLRPGNYSIMTRPAGASNIVSSFSFRILRPWYSSVFALILYSLAVIAMAVYFVYILYSRLLLRQRLKDKETENEERARLFIGLSHELRTPLSSVIGQLSLFFKRYGASLQGNALLRQSYKGALEMNRIVSRFLEVENSLEDEVDDLPVFDRAEMYPLGHGEYTMLVADDNADMRALLQNIFSGEYKLLVAENGREACEIARRQQPDIIVSDVMMPEMDGLTLCATLRRDYETRHIPIVLITAHASERHNLEGLELGADDYIAKPFSVELLRARCRALILNRKALAEHMYMKSGADIPSSESKRDKFLNAAIGAVERNLSSPQLSVALLCREMNMSKTSLTQRLEENAGMSPREFIEDVRLRHAARMIQDGEKRLADIADQLNFSSPKYFSIRFRKKFGVSPRDYSRNGKVARPVSE
ncbi:MAG: response regulator [Bacteroidales bacterium]|nr:response regulator [Bacteroidales bacterium]